MSGRWMVAAAALLGAASLLAGMATARANGVAQIVKLSYLEGVSTWGPKEAEGVLQISFAEAFARVEVKHLPPAAGFTYEGWLMAPDGKTFAAGAIPVQPDGIGTVEMKLTGLDRYDYNVFVVAARGADATDLTTVPTQKSIAGRFSVAADPRAGQSVGDLRPDALPSTGEAGPGWPWKRVATTGATMAGTALMLIAFKRRRARKEHAS